MKSITKQSIMKMMEEEMQNYTSNRSITKNKIRKMMEEELANMKENEFAGMGYSDDDAEEHEQVAIEKKNMMMSIEELLIHVSPKEVSRLLQDLAAQVEQGRIQEVLSESPDQLIMQYQNDAKGAAMGLLETARAMAKAPSTEPAKVFAAAVAKPAGEIVDAMVALEKYASGQEGLSEARKRPLKRHRDAFDKNTQMVSDLQKTISSFLKEGGAKLNKNHAAIIEKISTRLMHLANSPMIKLSEGDANSRMISSLERIGDDVKRIKHMSVDPAVLDVTDKLLEDIQQLWQDMMGVQ